MNLLSNSCQQTGRKAENGKNGPTHEPRSAPPQKFLLLLRYNPFIGVDEMRVKISRLMCRLGLVLRLGSVYSLGATWVNLVWSDKVFPSLVFGSLGHAYHESGG